MTRGEIKTETRYITRTNSTTYPDTVFDSGLEIVRKRVLMKAIRSITDWNLQGEIAQTDLKSVTGLTSGELGYMGEYPFPSDLVKLTRVDISYGDGFNGARKYFINDSSDSEEDETSIGSFSESSPAIKIYRNSYFVRPLPSSDVTGGLRIKYQVIVSDLAEDSSEPTEINALFHEIYVYGMAVRYGARYPEKMKNEWRSKFRELETEMMKFYTNRFRKDVSLKVISEDFS